ncbi:hypothetical protein CYY_003634 [Polysphondylium violaceum]|uniref:Transmembrane protein n=1 Tax=Polysphondylium violaceum TaxID=133409 RepID=A0A8J4PWI8_9MYCE|nr:hypothetical protein CYY_003634 [Polysphondylium violaceum]
MKIIGLLLLLLAAVTLCLGVKLIDTTGKDQDLGTFDFNQESNYTVVLASSGMSTFKLKMTDYSHVGKAFIVSFDALDPNSLKPMAQNLFMSYDNSDTVPTKSGVRISVCAPNTNSINFGLGIDQDIDTNLVMMSIKPDPTRSCQYYSLPKYSYINYVSSDSTLLKPTLFIVLLSALFFLF